MPTTISVVVFQESKPDIAVIVADESDWESRQPNSLDTLDVLYTVGAQSRRLGARMRAEGYSTLEELEAHYTGGDQPMSPRNYVWYQ